MDDQTKRKKVFCPVSRQDGKTYWLQLGSAFTNGDRSINVYLDCLPVNGRLQIRDWEDPPWEKRSGEKPEPATGRTVPLPLGDRGTSTPVLPVTRGERT